MDNFLTTHAALGALPAPLAPGLALGVGVSARVGALPAGFTSRAIVQGGAGINDTVFALGSALLAVSGKPRRDSAGAEDIGTAYISTWSDNGAYYYYHTEPNSTYEQTWIDAVASIKAQLLTYLSANRGDWLEPLVASLKLGGSFALAVLGNLILIPVVLFYLLKDWDRWVSQVVLWVPLHWRPAYDSFMRECDEVLGQYLHGQILVMLALSVFYAVGLYAFGLDLALPIGVFTGLAVCVPYLGFGLGLILALFAGFYNLHPSRLC
jgi:predicted PurR-regulated permease PerM